MHILDAAIPSGTHFTSCGYQDGRVCTCARTSARIEADRVRYGEKESSVSDSSRVEIDASRDLATIRLRTATGHLYDIDVQWLSERLVTDPTFRFTTTRVTPVPTWESIPIPDELDSKVNNVDLAWWKRGVTDANNATLNEEPK